MPGSNSTSGQPLGPQAVADGASKTKQTSFVICAAVMGNWAMLFCAALGATGGPAKAGCRPDPAAYSRHRDVAARGQSPRPKGEPTRPKAGERPTLSYLVAAGCPFLSPVFHTHNIEELLRFARTKLISLHFGLAGWIIRDQGRTWIKWRKSRKPGEEMHEILGLDHGGRGGEKGREGGEV
jgi:hypothetical protein